MAQHGQRDHAVLSASGSHRWMNCTPSVMLEERFGEEGDKTYAEEGTKAHELAELYIRRDILKERISTIEIERIKESKFYNNEMELSVDYYVGLIAEMFEEAKKADPAAQLITEQRVDLTQWVPESFGTTDCTIIANDTMRVIDLKYGKGVKVDAEGNPQLRLYALGSLKEHSFAYDIKTVQMTIIQPRIDHVSVEEMSVEDLIDWASLEVMPKAEMAFRGEGELNSGEWCQFCKIKNRCRKLYEENIEKAKLCFDEDPRIMSDDDVAKVVLCGDRIMTWIKGVMEYAELQAINEGKKFKGTKLVRGRSVRKWTDSDNAYMEILRRFPELSADQISTTKLSGIGDIEKLVGKKVFEAKLSDLTIKPEGKLQLVSMADKRPEADKAGDADKIFND